jgi:hypothetical protein
MPRRKPLTQADARALALELPETHEASHMGTPDLRVRGKIFATLPAAGKTVNVKTTPLNLDALVQANATTYRDVWGGRWVGVDLARVTRTELRDLLLEAWTLAAPKSLVRAYAAALSEQS